MDAAPVRLLEILPSQVRNVALEILQLPPLGPSQALNFAKLALPDLSQNRLSKVWSDDQHQLHLHQVGDRQSLDPLLSLLRLDHFQNLLYS